MAITDFVPRNMHFPFGDPQVFWYGGDPVMTRLFDGLSSILPVGEHFFVTAIKRELPFIVDPQLQRDVRAFIEQEALHRREHQAWNQQLATLGLDIEKLDASQRRVMFSFLRSPLPHLALAITVAVEHLTAVTGAATLSGEFLEGATPEMRALWEWHSVEEIEHKCVAFDVYRYRGGSERLRRAALLWVIPVVLIRVGNRAANLLVADGVGNKAYALKLVRRALFAKNGIARRLWPEIRPFFMKDFHPLMQDHTALLTKWNQSNAQGVSP